MKSKILIVDDNPLEIEYFKKNVDWEELEFEICATAYNGRRGLLMYDKVHPDLIILDIQMPGMTGGVIEIPYTLQETVLLCREANTASQRERERRAKELCEMILEKLVWFQKNTVESEKKKTGQIRLCLIGTGIKETQIREQYLKWKPYFNQRFLSEPGRWFTVEDQNQMESERKAAEKFFLKKEGSYAEEIDWKVVDLYQKQKEMDSFFSYISQCIDRMMRQRKMSQIFRSFSILFSKYEEKWNQVKAKQIGQESCRKIFAKEEMSSCDTIQKALAFWREQYQALEQEREKAEGTGYSRLTRRAISYIQRHYNEKGLDTNQIAQYVSLSPSRLRFVFKEEVGQTIGQYLTEVRMEKAKRLLLETTKHSDEIADEIGYLDGKYFRKMFKQKYGMTPKEFREREQN